MRSKHVGAFLNVLILTFQAKILLYIKVHQVLYKIQFGDPNQIRTYRTAIFYTYVSSIATFLGLVEILKDLGCYSISTGKYLQKIRSSVVPPQLVQSIRQGYCITMSRCRACAVDRYGVTDGVQNVDTPEAHTFRWPLSP